MLGAKKLCGAVLGGAGPLQDWAGAHQWVPRRVGPLLAGGLVVRIWHSHRRGLGSIPGRGRAPYCHSKPGLPPWGQPESKGT